MAKFFPFSRKGWRVHLLWLFLILLAAFVLFLEFFLETGASGQTPVSPTPIVEPISGAIPLPDRGLLTVARVLSVIDGDTIDVQIDGQTARVRYYGSNTQEREEPCAAEARARNHQLVEGKTVFLLASARDKDRGGRLLRYVFTSDGQLVDEILIREGLAKAWPHDGTYRDQLLAMEKAAARDGVGCLWSRRGLLPTLAHLL